MELRGVGVRAEDSGLGTPEPNLDVLGARDGLEGNGEGWSPVSSFLVVRKLEGDLARPGPRGAHKGAAHGASVECVKSATKRNVDYVGVLGASAAISRHGDLL